MPQPPTLKIVEIFASIQGEGLRQGEPTIFIRLAGCNLRCPFCDTKRAWKGGRGMPLERIVDRVARLNKTRPAEWIVLTGGEPLLQDVGPLVRLLKKKGFLIQIETNGIFYRRLPALVRAFNTRTSTAESDPQARPGAPAAADWYTVSPKPPAYAFRPEYATRAREVKLVASRELTFAVVARVRDAFPLSVPLLIQPESNAAASRAKALRLLRRAAKEGRTNVRLSLQMHKILRLP
ncbi:MAG: 7-carboxy-7-deazaguanine synthase QueE [Candidatus Aminicenantales bacterium]